MFWSFCVSIIVCLVVVNAQPISCQEDAHCAEGYFCETQTNVCKECLRCKDYKRESPPDIISNACIKSIASCGPCSDGFTNIYGKGIKGKCVLPNHFDFGNRSYYAFVWMTAAFISIFIVVGFVYVIRHTDVFRIVAYYDTMPGTTSQAGVIIPSNVPSPRHLLKCLLHFEKQHKETKDPANK